MRSTINPREKAPHIGLRRTAATALAALALVGVIDKGPGIVEAALSSNSGNNVYNPTWKAQSAHLSDGSIPAHVNFRTSPTRIEESGDSNSCAALGQTVEFPATDVTIDDVDSRDGPWVGFSRDALPQNVQDACANDKDGIIWVAQRYVQER